MTVNILERTELLLDAIDLFYLPSFYRLRIVKKIQYIIAYNKLHLDLLEYGSWMTVLNSKCFRIIDKISEELGFIKLFGRWVIA